MRHYQGLRRKVAHIAWPNLRVRGLISQGDHPPIVFLTGHGDIPSSVRAIKHGAVDFLTKPFTERDLLDAIQSAVERDRQARQDRAELESLQQRFRKPYAA